MIRRPYAGGFTKLAFVLAAGSTGCVGDVAVVSTFAGHWEAVLDDSNVARDFDPEAIRSDFSAWYDSVVVAADAERYLGGASSEDEVVQELRRLKMLGAWREELDCIMPTRFCSSRRHGCQRERRSRGTWRFSDSTPN